MKFEELYKQVFISEKNGVNTEVAEPADFDDVEPAPLPPTPEVDVNADPTLSPETASPVLDGGSNLGQYISQLEEFADKLNSTAGESLQTLVSQLDKADTPFEGIYARTSAEIVDAAKTLRSISEKLKNFIIYAAKK